MPWSSMFGAPFCPGQRSLQGADGPQDADLRPHPERAWRPTYGPLFPWGPIAAPPHRRFLLEDPGFILGEAIACPNHVLYLHIV